MKVQFSGLLTGITAAVNGQHWSLLSSTEMLENGQTAIPTPVRKLSISQELCTPFIDGIQCIWCRTNKTNQIKCYIISNVQSEWGWLYFQYKLPRVSNFINVRCVRQKRTPLFHNPTTHSEVSLMEPNTLYQRGFLNTLFFHILNYKKCSLTISLVTQSTDVNTDVVCSKIRYTTIGYTTIGDPGV